MNNCCGRNFRTSLSFWDEVVFFLPVGSSPSLPSSTPLLPPSPFLGPPPLSMPPPPLLASCAHLSPCAHLVGAPLPVGLLPLCPSPPCGSPCHPLLSHHHHPPASHLNRFIFCFELWCNVSGQPMAERVTGAAARRCGRRLRSWWRHEQQSVSMALAEALHHSWTVDEESGGEARGTGGGGARDARCPTETECTSSRDAEGARGAVGGSHGRLRGCRGPSPGGAVAATGLPPGREPQVAEGGGEGEEAEAGGGGARGAHARARPTSSSRRASWPG